MSDPSAGGNHMIAENSLLARPETLDGGAGSFVQRIGLELDANAPQGFESVPQQQVLRLRVRRRSLPRAGEPGPTDLDASMVEIDVPVARAAADAAAGLFDDREGQRSAMGLLCERVRDVRRHFV